jgi:hypothetical protein
MVKQSLTATLVGKLSLRGWGMKRTQVARECADALHGTEASLEATLISARKTLERLTAARAEMGLTGTVGDAGLARIRESVAALEEAAALIREGHQEAYAVLKTVDVRTSMELTRFPEGFARTDDSLVA